VISTPKAIILLTLLMALAVYVLARRRTRGLAGVALVAATSGLVAVLELSGWWWRTLAEGAILGLAGSLANSGPSWLLAHRGFAAEYAAVDKKVWQQMQAAEVEWQARRIDDAEYARRFDRSNVRYRALEPPPGEWNEIIDERIRIREAWSRILQDPRASPQAERDELMVDEEALRRRIARAGG
jgi:hypothetical protein